MASLEELKKQLNGIQTSPEQMKNESSGLVSPEESEAMDKAVAGPSTFEQLRTQINSIPEDSMQPTGGQLGLWDRAKLSFRRTPEVRKEFLRQRNISPEQFDEQDATEGIGGWSPADLADLIDTAALTIMTTAGEVGGGALAGAAALPTGIGIAPAAFTGAVAGGAGMGALYSSIRNELVKAASVSGKDDSDILIDTVSGALGPFFGAAIKVGGKAAGGAIKDLASKSAAVDGIISGIKKADSYTKNKVAGVISLVSGADPAATKAFVKAPEESLLRAEAYRKNSAEAVKDFNTVIQDAVGLRKEVNKVYRQELKELSPQLDQLKFQNAAEKIVPAGSGDDLFVDSAGNKIAKSKIEYEIPELKAIENEYNFSSIDKSYIPKSISEIIEKPELTFKDFDALRQERNNLFKIVSSGNQEAAKALSYVGRLYDKVATELPQSGPGEARELFTAMNNKYGKAYNALDNLTSQFSKGSSDIPKIGQRVKQQVNSTDFLTKANLSKLRQDAEVVMRDFAPKSRILDNYDKTVGAYTAQTLFRKGALMRAAQATGMGALAGDAFGGKGTGAAVGATLGMLGQAPGLGVVAGAALGKANPAAQFGAKELLQTVDSRRQLGPALGRIMDGSNEQ